MVLVRILRIILMLFLEETENMNRLIVEMLELAKLESGTYKLDMTTFSIGELTQQVYTKLLFSMEEKTFTSEHRCRPFYTC